MRRLHGSKRGVKTAEDLVELMWRMGVGKEILEKRNSLCKSPETGDLQGFLGDPG